MKDSRLPITRLLVYPARVLLVGLLSCPAVLGQSPAKRQTGPAEVGQLIAEAKAADSPDGNYTYSRHLTDWFVAHQTGNAYKEAFARRLSRADLLARHHERVWIPESVVAQAYNDLLKQIHGHFGMPPRTDTNVVHQLRITLSEVSPAFSTVNSHSSECLPTEAVQLMYQLLEHDGSVEGPCPPTPDPNGTLVPQSPCAVKDDPITLMFKYSRSHSASEQQKPFDHVARLFGFSTDF